MPFATACSLNVGGCNITILVDDAGGRESQREIVAMLEARVADVAAMVEAGLRVAAPPDDWSLVEDAVLDGGAAPARFSISTPPAPHPVASAVQMAAVKACGGAPPVPPTPVDEGVVPPPPPPAAIECARPAPPRAMVKAFPTVAAAVAPPTADDRAWAQIRPAGGVVEASRLADATQHGTLVAMAWAAGLPAPKAPALPPPLRNRVWAAVGGAPEGVGLYARWQPMEDQRGAATVAAQAYTVVGYPSLAEALAFGRGAGVVLPDRRYV